MDLLIGAAVFVGGLLAARYLPSYLEQKGRNLATREDLAELTKIPEEIKHQYALLLERVRPETAEEVLRVRHFSGRDWKPTMRPSR